MSRKRSIIISLILLLLIGGGAAFYLHLRAHAPPKFSEVEMFLEQLPSSHGWERKVSGKQSLSNLVRVSWIQVLNPFSDGTSLSERSYKFKRRDSGVTRLNATYATESGKVSEIIIRSDPADSAEAGEFQRLLLGKFPNLRHVVQVNP